MKKLVKKVAVLGAGTLMMGATLTSAVALDLADYPSPYLVDGEFDTSSAIVVGDNAAASDTIGAVDVSNHWQVNSYTTTSGAGVTVSGGQTEKVPIDDVEKNTAGGGVSNPDSAVASSSYIDSALDDADLPFLLDSTVNFKSESIDFHEEILISQKSPVLATSLTSSDDDYLTEVAMELAKESIGYYYIFDEAINVSLATSTDALEIDFLGKRLKITSASATKFTAQVGEEHFMKVGDSVTVDGKTVTLNNVGSGGAIVVDVDGEVETISSSGTETVNGVEINNDETFYDSNDVSQRSATVIIGTDATETYSDGDAYTGEDENNPDWVWDIQFLTQNTASSVVANATGITVSGNTPAIGILNDFSVNSDDDDNIVGSKEGWASCYSLPNKFAELCLDSLTLDDDDYMRLKIETIDDLDVSKLFGNLSSDQKAILLQSDESEGLQIDISELTNTPTTVTTDKKTNKIWLHNSGSSDDAGAFWINVFFWDTTNSNISYAGYAIPTNLTAGDYFGYVNWGDTKDDKDGTQGVAFSLVRDSGSGVANAPDLTALHVDVGRDDSKSPKNTYDDFNITFKGGNANGTAFTALGSTASSEEAGEVFWMNGNITNTSLGTKDEDHMSIYGLILRNPKSNGANDEVVFDIPNDQLYGNIVVRGASTKTATTGNRLTVAIETDTTKLSSEVAGKEASFNLILVGGPCVNPTISAVSGLSDFASCGDWGLESGEGVIKLVDNGDNVAMLVAGTDALDTRRAAKALTTKALSGTEVIVKGTTLTDITVETA